MAGRRRRRRYVPADRGKTIFRLGGFAHSREIPIFRRPPLAPPATARWRSGIIDWFLESTRASARMSLHNRDRFLAPSRVLAVVGTTGHLVVARHRRSGNGVLAVSSGSRAARRREWNEIAMPRVSETLHSVACVSEQPRERLRRRVHTGSAVVAAAAVPGP